MPQTKWRICKDRRLVCHGHCKHATKHLHTSLKDKLVLILPGAGRHYHLDVLCPMVQEPMSAHGYKLKRVENVSDVKLEVSGIHPVHAVCTA